METRAALLPRAQSARDARAFVDRTLRAWECPDLVDRARLLVSELVTNALLHARGPTEVRICRDGATVRVEVADPSPVRPRRRRRMQPTNNGLGVRVLDAMSDRWGSERRGSGKVVWFELETAAAAHTRRQPLHV